MTRLDGARLAAAATFLLGCALSFSAAEWERHHNRIKAEQRFQLLSAEVAAEVKARMSRYEYGLRGARGALVAGGEQFDRQRFHEYSATRDIGREFPGAHGFGIIRRVAPGDEAAFVANARHDGWPDFAVRQIAPHEGERDLVQYIEPVEPNRAAIGLDIASDGARRDAAAKAMRSGEATLTAPITLVQTDQGSGGSFLLMLPIYRPGAPTDTEEERVSAAIGWTFAPLVIGEVLKTLDLPDLHLSLNLRDVGAAGTPAFFESGGSASTMAADLSRRISIPIFGRSWEAEILAKPDFLEQLGQIDPLAVAAAGLTLAALMALLAYFAGIAFRRTAQLGIEQARLAAIVAGSADAIIGESLDGVITDWNSAAEKLFGCPASEAIGQRAAQLLLPPGREGEDRLICAMIAEGVAVPPFDSTRRRRDGSLIHVSITASPIHGKNGHRLGFSKTVRDISEARAAQKALADLNASLEGQVAERTAELDKARHRLQTILDAVPSQIGYWDNQLINHSANSAYRDWFGLEPESLRGTHISALLGPEIYANNRPYLEAALRGIPQTFRGLPVPRPDGGGTRHTLVNYLPDIVDGQQQGIYSFVYDISEVVEKQAKLAEAERDLRVIFDAMPSMIGYWDKFLVNRIANSALEKWFGVEPGALRNRRLSEFYADNMDTQNRLRIEAALHGQAQTFEQSIPRPGGSGLRHYLTQYVPDLVDGEVRGFYSLRHDITEIAESRIKLAALQRDNDGLLQTIQKHSIVSIADRAGRITDVNDAFCSISGFSREELLGQTHRIVNSGTHDPEFWPSVWRTISRGESWRGEVCNRARDGSLYWVDSIISPFIGADGRVEKYISIRSDISARKRYAETLREANARFELAAASAMIGVWEYDLVSGLLKWDERMYELYGRPRTSELATYDLWRDSLRPDEVPRCECALHDAIAGIQPFDIEFCIVHPDGTLRYIRAAALVTRDSVGAALRMTGVNIDVTERVGAQLKLQESNTRFQLAAAAGNIGVWEIDIATRTLKWDERMYELYGRTGSEGLDPFEVWLDGVSEEERERSKEAMWRMLESEQAIDTEFQITRPDGTIRYIKSSGMSERNPAGEVIRQVGVNIDLTDRVHAQNALEEMSVRLRSVLDSATELSIIATDLEGTITIFNRGAQRMLGYDESEIVGKLTPALIHVGDEVRSRGEELSLQYGESISGFEVFIHRARRHGSETREWTYVRKNGSRLPVSLTVTAMRDRDGVVFGFLGIAYDVSQRKEYELSIGQAMRAAEDANRAKTQFLANMSHEIRTPMNAVIGLSYLLENTELDHRQSNYLSKIQLASKALLAIINDILDLSKIEAGELRIEQSPFSIYGVLDDLSSLITVQLGTKGIDFEIAAPANLPSAVIGDATRLHQILLNLLTNAVKFTEKGCVRLHVQQAGAESSTVRLKFIVEDTGIGIPPEKLEELFIRFVQAEDSTTRRFGGSGLGLSIVRQLAGLMGGEVGVTSTPGVGSRFWVELNFPLADTNASQLPGPLLRSPVGNSLPRLRVLVADDSAVNLEVAQHILELEGAVVFLAHNGEEAVAHLQAHPDAIDIVLMDVQMPVLDGYGATRRIRGKLGLSQLPVIALTAGTLSSEREQAAAAGMSDFVTKPFEPRELIRVILRHVLPNPRERAAAARNHVATTEAYWPEIHGIESDDVRRRFHGDFALFRSMLRRMLDDYADLDGLQLSNADSLQVLGERMHSLKGSAGTLGANSLADAAAETEDACRAQQADQAADMLVRVANLRGRLEAKAFAVLEAYPVAEDGEVGLQPSDIGQEALDELIEALNQSSFDAVNLFAGLSPALKQKLDGAAFASLREQVQNLQFGDAAELLERFRRSQLGAYI